ncbi:MAG: HTTM domain-containing protein, partial [Vicingaceae bacterium]|nr:HTTM domain-containing protein [Vicingaceae bacterium]
SGLVFDLLIGFLIWSSKTRKYALIIYVLFNLLNFWLFYDIGEIGFFPFLLLACFSIFLNPKFIEEKLTWLSKNNKNVVDAKVGKRSLITFCLSSYIVLQVILPFRHLLYDNQVDFSGKGQRFAWRMKIMYKVPEMHFYLVEEDSDKKIEVNVGNFLTTKQYTNLIYYPDFIPPVANYIKEEGVRRGLKNPKVVADFEIGFMGYEKQYLFDPQLDLSKVSYKPFENSRWIFPLKKL